VLIEYSHAIPEGVEAFDEYVATQGYPTPLKSVHPCFYNNPQEILLTQP
jgi:hypothetical protein